MNDCKLCGSPVERTKVKAKNYCHDCFEAIFAEAQAGYSMRAIGEKRDMTRNQVIGLINRNKPVGYRHIAAQKRAPRKRRPLTRTQVAQAVEIISLGGSQRTLVETMHVGSVVASRLWHAAKLTIAADLDLQPVTGQIGRPKKNLCQFPMWENSVNHTYCQEPLAPNSRTYCAHHHDMCYRDMKAHREERRAKKLVSKPFSNDIRMGAWA